jgi:predicted GNAT family N-acyltransferase
MLHAQVHAVPFYEKMGFKSYGPQFEEAGIQHFAMSIG